MRSITVTTSHTGPTRAGEAPPTGKNWPTMKTTKWQRKRSELSVNMYVRVDDGVPTRMRIWLQVQQ